MELKETMKSLVECTYRFSGIYGFAFGSPTEEQEITAWENTTGIPIPAQYKEWLRFTSRYECGAWFVELRSPSHFIYHQPYLPEDLVIIGSCVGDGEMICFSKTTGDIIFDDHGELSAGYTFQELLEELIEHYYDTGEMLPPDEIDEAYLPEMRELLSRLSENKLS